MANKITALNEKQARKLSNRLDKISNKLDKITGEIASTQQISNVYWSGIQRDIKKVYEELRKVTYIWTNSSMPIMFHESIRDQINKIKSAKIVDPRVNKNISYKTFINKDSNKQSLGAMIAETNASFNTGFLQGEKTFVQLCRMTQQINIRENQIDKQIAQGYIEKGSVQGSQKKLQKALLKKAIDGKQISVIANTKKGPKEYKYNVKSYSEMVARTKLQQISAQGVINTAASVGADLVQVSAHNTQTALCSYYEGKIFSLSGNSNKFPVLDQSPPFHPNCLHTLSVVFEEALKADGTLQDYIDFSNDEIGIHPTRKSFIPLNERTLK